MADEKITRYRNKIEQLRAEKKALEDKLKKQKSESDDDEDEDDDDDDDFLSLDD